MGGTGWHITVTECQLEFCMYIMKLKEGWEEEGWGGGGEEWREEEWGWRSAGSSGQIPLYGNRCKML